MDFKTIDELQKSSMLNDVENDIYEWENKHLYKELLGLVEEINIPNKNNEKYTPEEFECIEKMEGINSWIRKYNYNFINNEKIVKEINELYDVITKKSKFYININYINEQLKFNDKIILTGPSGIGKSRYIFDLYSKCEQIKYQKCFLYGKYYKLISEDELKSLIENIKKYSINDKILFVVDAFNEFDEKQQNILFDFFKDTFNENIRLIVTNRDFALEQTIEKNLYSLFDNEIPFAGVDIVNSICRISEECNIDLTKYGELIYDNNPLHLKMLKNVISDNRLENMRNNSISIGTNIFETFIKNVTKKYCTTTDEYWWDTKTIMEYVLKNEIRFLDINIINLILGKKSLKYLEVMQKEDFIKVNNNLIIFKSESLESYLLVRGMFAEFPTSKVQQIKYIDQKLTVFSFIHEQVIIMLFDKVKSVKRIAELIRKTNLKHYFNDLTLFNRIKLSDEKKRKFNQVFKCNASIEKILFTTAGFENNPINCKNYLNKKILQLKITDYNFCVDKPKIINMRNNLVSWIRTISTFECSDEYIEEKFWCAFWCMSVVNKDIRYLSRKLIFEIVLKKDKYINILKTIYSKINDEFIKEGIIQVLCSQNHNNIGIKRFINKINTSDLLNFRSLYYISKYLYQKENYVHFDKENILKKGYLRRRDKNIFDFFKRTIMINSSEYNVLGFERYSERVKYQIPFIKEDKKLIERVNKYVQKKYKCKTYCYYTETLRNDILKSIFSNIDESTIKDYDVYFAWQNVFKDELKKYNIKTKELDGMVAYNEETKNIAYKALEIANNKLIGSLASNYYTNEFIIDNNYLSGYSIYFFEHHSEIIDLYSPITIFSEDIDYLNNAVMNKIDIPSADKINQAWSEDEKLSLKNFKRIIQPIRYKNKNWIIIFGSIKIKKENGLDLLWSDEYIINLAINEKFTLTEDSSIDRKYTIETLHYAGNINNYITKSYTQTTSLTKNSFWNNFFIESDFNMPPSIIVKEFNLKYDNKQSAWINENNEVVIYASNNKDSWYKNGVTGSIFIDEKYYNEIKQKYDLKYFAFTERFFNGYNDNSSLEIEYYNDNKINCYKHYLSNKNRDEYDCSNCIVYQKSQNQLKRHRKTKYEKLIAKYISSDIVDE